ncbi:proteinase-activated receptor 2 isoform X1 [Ursus maritimus]|uniref:Proteinase-activated receptor 2 isoform X1 n=2 Tax=Ursus maritimus TaxID=29073 RepID=A0A8M1F440_URSMA|nr:proteinase-activated receptor 2 isoform X1 [Ursus maritimus]
MGPRQLLLVAAGLSLCGPLLSARTRGRKPGHLANLSAMKIGLRTDNSVFSGLRIKVQSLFHGTPFIGTNRTSKGRSLIGKVDSSSHVTGKGVTVETGFSVDDFSASILTGRLTTVFLPIVYTIVFVIGLPSNGMALWVFLFRTKKKHPAVIYMANLALADLLSVIWFPLKIAYHIHGNNWIYGEALCKVLIGFFYGNMYCSILFMTCLSVQRYWVIVNPLVHPKKKANIAFGVSLGIWLLILLVTIPLYVMKQTVYIPALNITTCHDVLPEKLLVGDMFNYFLSLAIGVFLFPAFLTASAYVLMIRTLRSSAMDENSEKKRQRAIKLIVTVLATYLICFTPSNLLLVVHYFLIKTRSQSHVYALYVAALCLSTLNSCIDPFVYYFVSQDFRDHVKNALLCRSVRTVQQMQISLTSKKFSRKSSSYSSSSTSVKTSY